VLIGAGADLFLGSRPGGSRAAARAAAAREMASSAGGRCARAWGLALIVVLDRRILSAFSRDRGGRVRGRHFRHRRRVVTANMKLSQDSARAARQQEEIGAGCLYIITNAVLFSFLPDAEREHSAVYGRLDDPRRAWNRFASAVGNVMMLVPQAT